jgi:RNA polymerase sigma-70 factor (ECF subfamily)
MIGNNSVALREGRTTLTTVEKIDPSGEDADGDARRLIRLEAIATQYYGRLTSFFRLRTGSQTDARDLAQDAFAKLSAANLDHVHAPGPFLYATANNLLRDRARSRLAREAALTGEADFERLIDPKPLAEQALAGKQQLAILEAALLELPPKCRAVLVLYRFDDLSHRAIADRLGISVSMVEKYLKRALDHCRRRVHEANGEPCERKPAA